MTVRLEDVLAERLAPGMVVFLDSTAMAAARALVTVFGGTSPGFTVVIPRGGMIVPELLTGSVVAKVISGGLLNPHLGRVPPPIVQEAFRSGAVEFELLTLQTIGSRLMAGALGWPFVPTRSIAGSDLEKSFPGTARRVSDPFGAAEHLVLSPLMTDVAIGHAMVADRSGRALFPESSDHGGWGMRSCRNGAVVLAEAMVDEVTDGMPGARLLPTSQVLAVCEARGAAAPYGFDGRVPDVAESYAADPARIAAPPAAGFEAAGEVSRTVSGVAHALRPRSHSVGAGRRRDLSTVESVYLAGCELVRRVRASGIAAVLEGSGKAKAVTDFATAVLAEDGMHLDRVAGIAGLRSQRVGPSPLEAYGYLLGGPGRRSLGCISALQIDRAGNVNNTVLRDGPTMLVGSGGSNDAAGACTELMVVTSGDPGTVVRDVEFVTVPGRRVQVVVAGRCVFERSAAGILELVRVLEPVSSRAEELLTRARECGWLVSERVEHLSAPAAPQRHLIESALSRSR